MTSLGPEDALPRWKAQVVACREAQRESEDEAWQRAAEWYQDSVRHNDYVDLVLPRLLAVVGPTDRVLEIGPCLARCRVALDRAAGREDRHLRAQPRRPRSTRGRAQRLSQGSIC
jgi:hypothetical protein